MTWKVTLAAVAIAVIAVFLLGWAANGSIQSKFTQQETERQRDAATSLPDGSAVERLRDGRF